MQAALYLDATGKDFYYIVAAETKPPFSVVVYQLTNELIEYGRNKYKKLINQFISWKNAGCFPHSYEYWNPEDWSCFSYDLPNYLKNEKGF